MAKPYAPPELGNIPIDNSDIYIKDVPTDIMRSLAEVFFPTIEEYFKRKEETS